MHRLFTVLIILGFCLQLTAADPAGIEFFEKKIRPVLVSECYKCHSKEKKVKGELRLDWKGGWQEGGESGAAIIPGQPGKSLLIQSIRHADEDLKMPEKKKLTPEQIADFEKWVAMGAPDPRTTGEVSSEQKELDLEAERQFWAFQPVMGKAAPKVKDTKWPRNPIDRFIRAAQEDKGIVPVADADDATLLRRLYFDLIGLPPTPAQMDTFGKAAKTDRAEAIGNVIDELLASPHFGERWGRHWLDVARFSESTGGGRTLLMKEAWRYRDYVANSFNADKPYDQFVREQIAGDLIEGGTPNQRYERLAATAFLLLGPSNYELQDKTVLEMDIIDEQLDTMGKAFLGLTIGCARCHDHKFDPISTEDYYGMAGIFKGTKVVVHSNVSIWNERSIPMSPEQKKLYKEQSIQIAALKKEINKLKKKTGKNPSETGPTPVDSLQGIVVDDLQAKLKGEWTLSTSNKGYVGENYIHDGAVGKGEKSATYKIKIPEDGKFEVRVSYTHGDNRDSKVPVLIRHADGEVTKYIDQTKNPPIEGHFISLGTYDFLVGEWEAVVISTKGTTQHVIADAVQFLPEGTKSSRKKKTKKPDDFDGIVIDNPDAKVSGTWGKSEGVKNHVGSEYLFTSNPNNKVVYPVKFPKGGKYEVRISFAHHPNRSSKTLVKVRHNDGEKTFRINQKKEPAADGYFQSLGFFEFQSGPSDAVEISAMGSDGAVVADAVQFLPKGAPVVAQKKPKAEKNPVKPDPSADKARLSKMQKELKSLEAKAIKQPKIIAAEEAENPGDIQIAIRGNVHNAGPKTPRRFIEVLNRGPLPIIAPKSSGRMALANWLASAEHPLTARVFVNRVWHHLFGQGLVTSVDNFGHMGRLPANQALLDHLAMGFVEQGWSVKKLIRKIVLSRVYQLSSESSPLQTKADVENNLFWRQNRRRLQAEAIRDSILSVSSQLNLKTGGATIKDGTTTEYGYEFDGTRRSIYTPVFRNTPLEIMQVFDFADPNLVIGERTTSSIPTQALFLMNSPFMREQAESAAKALLAENLPDKSSRIEQTYRRTLGRSATSSEREVFLKFLESEKDEAKAWRQIFHGLYASPDFRYLN